MGPMIAELLMTCDESGDGLGMAAPKEPTLGADAFYDAGHLHCGYAPLDRIAQLMRALEPGGTLEVYAEQPSLANDLPAWCRLSGYELTQCEKERFLIEKP